MRHLFPPQASLAAFDMGYLYFYAVVVAAERQNHPALLAAR